MIGAVIITKPASIPIEVYPPQSWLSWLVSNIANLIQERARRRLDTGARA